MRVSSVALAILLWILSVGTGVAAPILVTEPPDLPASAGPTYAVDVGTNTITGSVNGWPGGFDYQDQFSIFVPGHLLVTSASVSIHDFNNLGGAAGLGCFSGAGCFGSGLFASLGIPASGSTLHFTASSPWQEDLQGGVNIGSFKYTLTLDVATRPATVPEPGTWALMLAVLGGAGMLRRR